MREKEIISEIDPKLAAKILFEDDKKKLEVLLKGVEDGMLSLSEVVSWWEEQQGEMPTELVQKMKEIELKLGKIN